MTDHVGETLATWAERRPGWDLAGMAVFGRISRLERLAELRRVEALREGGLTTGDVDVLASLWRHSDGQRPRDLRRTMLVGSGTLTPRLDQLEAAGLLARHPDPEDLRGRILRLTDRGRDRVEDLVHALLDIENGLLAGLPMAVRDRLARDLGRLLAEVESDTSG